jgi:hypothetical protein
MLNAVEVAGRDRREAGLGDPAERLPSIHDLVAIDHAVEPLVVPPEPTGRSLRPRIILSAVWVRRDDCGSTFPGLPQRGLEPIVDRTEGAQASTRAGRKSGVETGKKRRTEPGR